MNKVDLNKVGDPFLVYCWENLAPRDRAKILAGSPKTIWLFGAGASHHYDLNLRGASDFSGTPRIHRPLYFLFAALPGRSSSTGSTVGRKYRRFHDIRRKAPGEAQGKTIQEAAKQGGDV